MNLNHTDMINGINALEVLVKNRYPVTEYTRDTSHEWQMRRRRLNQLWQFSELIKDDMNVPN